MNTTSTPSTSRSTACEPRQRDESASPRERDDFERALRSRQEEADDDGQAVDAAPSAPWAEANPPHPCATMAPPLPLAGRTEPALPTSAAGAVHVAEGPADATRAAIGTALQAEGTPVSALCGRTASASSWQVTINDPRGVPVELRAARVAQAQPTAGQPAWALTLAGPLRETALLVRHAPRLDERLRARGLSDTPVQADPGDDEDTR